MTRLALFSAGRLLFAGEWALGIVEATTAGVRIELIFLLNDPQP